MKNLLAIFFSFFFFIAHAQVFNIRGVVVPTGSNPSISLAPSSFSQFTTTAGTSSANQSTNVVGTNLTANIVVTCVTGYEISTDAATWVTTTRTFTQSGGNASGTLYCRLLASDAAGSYSGNLTFTSVGATTRIISLSGTVSSGSPLITINPTSLGGFSTTSGTPSAPQSFTASGSTLLGDITVTAPSSYEVSLDNSSFATTQTLTQSGGTVNAQSVFVRIAASASPGSPSGNVALTSPSATTKNVAVSGTVSSSGGKDSIKVNLDTTQLMSVSAGWVNMTGDPHFNVISVTNTSAAITVTSVATANWINYAGNCAYPNNGNTNYTVFPAQAVKECWYSNNGGASNNDLFNAAKAKFHVTGLKPGSTYTITIGGSFVYNFTASTEYRVYGLNTMSPTTIDCHNNVSNFASWNNISPTAGGALDIFVNAATGQEMGVVTAFTIVEN